MGKAPTATAAKKAPTKSEVYSSIAEATGLSKKDVAGVLDALAVEIKKNVGNRGPGIFTIPGLIKVTKKKVAARPAQKAVKNPFTGEIRDVPAKPAYNKIAVRALKNLKDMAK